MEQISKQSYLDSCDDCEATDRARIVLDQAPIGTIVYVSQDSNANGLIMQLFTNPHDAACAFVGIPLLWDAQLVTVELAGRFMREAMFFLEAPREHEGTHTLEEEWGGSTTCSQLYAAEVIE